MVLETRTGDFVTSFGGPVLVPRQQSIHINYALDPSSEKYFVHVPDSYSGEKPFGLIVFTDAGDDYRQLPDGWQRILDLRSYLYVAAQNAGNNQDVNRRLGLAVLGAMEMMKRYKVDPSRVYAAGFSGGARMSSLLGFYQNDIFRGTIQSCGADFYKPVPQVATTSSVDTAGSPYGLLASDATSSEIAARRIGFVLITGSRDFRRGNIIDIYNGGFAREGFRTRLFDVPGMPHDTADSKTLSEALDFLEESR